MFEALRCRRRIILSGTPIQNDLSEFHAMADFCNPGLLGGFGFGDEMRMLTVLP